MVASTPLELLRRRVAVSQVFVAMLDEVQQVAQLRASSFRAELDGSLRGPWAIASFLAATETPEIEAHATAVRENRTGGLQATEAVLGGAERDS
jgi:hypothetical protein